MYDVFLFSLQIMAKLLPNHQSTLLQSDVVQIIHDKVVSLCRKKYTDVDFIEIDGIICISLLDTKEQQVVKIHKTLTSISGKTGAKERINYDTNTHEKGMQRGDGHRNEGEHKFEKDICTLSDLLKTTVKGINDEQRTKGIVDRKSKRKRKHPRQITTAESESLVENVKKSKHYDSGEDDERAFPGVNPFLHSNGAVLSAHAGSSNIGNDVQSREDEKNHDRAEDCIPLVKVKEEPVDPEYETGTVQPKIVSIRSIGYEQTEANDGSDKVEEKDGASDKVNNAKAQKVSSIIERLIEQDFNRRSENSSKHSADGMNSKLHSNAEATAAEKAVDGTEYVTVKTEKVDSDNEIGTTSSNNDTADESENVQREKENDSKAHNQFASLFGLYNVEGKTDDTKNSTSEQARQVQEKNRAKEKSWIDMVKDNVSKYQAALIRSGKSATPLRVPELSLNETDAQISDNVAMVQPLGSGSVHSNPPSNLLSLLQKPPMIPHRAETLGSNSVDFEGPTRSGASAMEYGNPVRSSSVPRNLSAANSGSDRSRSCSPVVKIEVDDIDQTYYSDTGRHSGGNGNQRSAAISDKPGKLESKYPALFNQLQASRNEQQAQNYSESESLVNRLPFISFQEIFSSAASGGPVPKLSESTTRQLLERARERPLPYKPVPKKKTVWNWKKRLVKPKKIDPEPVEMLSEADENGQVMGRSDIYFNMHLSSRKTFSKGNSKGNTDSDQEWKPTEEGTDSPGLTKDSMVSERGSHQTRLSRGKMQRINFAEMESSNSDIDDCINDNEPEIEFVSAYCSNNCGLKFETVYELEAHEKQCKKEGLNLMIPSGLNEQLRQSMPGNSSSEQYNCSVCGLDFNQKYRWQYHMIKVHGLTADKVNMFR